MDCASNFDEFLSADKLTSTTDDKKTCLDGPSCKHVATLVPTEEGGKMEEMHLL
jgi:hypothetical protein